MRSITFLFSIALIVLAPSALACDANETCGDTCILPRPWGGCAQTTHDFICETRKAACQIPVAGPAVTLPGTPLGPGGVFGPGGPGIGPVTGEDMKHCLEKPEGCSSRIVSEYAYQVVAPKVDQYISYLQMQAKDRWKPIPGFIITKVGHKYPEIDLNNVRYAENIETIHKQHITIGREIFFTSKINMENIGGICLLAHELQHVVQYEKRGGVRPFLAEYISKVVGKVIERGSFEIHDDIDLEREAIAKSSEILELYGWKSIENCNIPRISFSTSTGGIDMQLRSESNRTVRAPAQPDPERADGWIALQDVGEVKSFLDKQGRTLLAEDVMLGDIASTNRDINLRPRPAKWDKITKVITRGTQIQVLDMTKLPAGEGRSQIWVKIAD